MSNATQVTFEIVPHPRFRGDWSLRPKRGGRGGCMVRKSGCMIAVGHWPSTAIFGNGTNR